MLLSYKMIKKNRKKHLSKVYDLEIQHSIVCLLTARIAQNHTYA